MFYIAFSAGTSDFRNLNVVKNLPHTYYTGQGVEYLTVFSLCWEKSLKTITIREA